MCITENPTICLLALEFPAKSSNMLYTAVWTFDSINICQFDCGWKQCSRILSPWYALLNPCNFLGQWIVSKVNCLWKCVLLYIWSELHVSCCISEVSLLFKTVWLICLITESIQLVDSTRIGTNTYELSIGDKFDYPTWLVSRINDVEIEKFSGEGTLMRHVLRFYVLHSTLLQSSIIKPYQYPNKISFFFLSLFQIRPVSFLLSLFIY